MSRKNSSKVFVVGTVGVPACYGGFESLVENLVINTELEYTVFCSSKSYSEKIPSYNCANLIYLPVSANGIQSIIYDILSLIICVIKRADCVLLLGVSGAVSLPLVKLFAPKMRIVTNIDGLEWKRAKWGRGARRFLKFSERIAVRSSDAVVADNAAIVDHVESEYSKKAHLISYGGDHAIVKGIESNSTDCAKYYLALCRIEPENNIEMILEGAVLADINLKFIGNWDNSEYGRRLKADYSRHENINLMDPIYDLDELYSIRCNCEGYFHGHSAGGTNPSLVEMMHFSVNIFCFDCNYNRESSEGKAHYFQSAQDIPQLVNTTTPNGKQMVEIALRKYTWEIVRTQYEELLYDN